MRHTFARITSLNNVAGRIDYISSSERQEYKFATYSTISDQNESNTFWANLATECRLRQKELGDHGDAIEAREIVFALPNEIANVDLNRIDELSDTELEALKQRLQPYLESLVNEFHEREGVECSAAIHLNHKRTNLHAHLIFADRIQLDDAKIKRATRDLFYDENGKRVYKKKLILDENKQLKPGCRIVKKGEKLSERKFSTKLEQFSSKDKTRKWVAETKQWYTDWANTYVSSPETKFQVYNRSLEPHFMPEQHEGKIKKYGHDQSKSLTVMRGNVQRDNEYKRAWNKTLQLAQKAGVPNEKIKISYDEYRIDLAKLKENQYRDVGGFRQIVERMTDALRFTTNQYLDTLKKNYWYGKGYGGPQHVEQRGEGRILYEHYHEYMERLKSENNELTQNKAKLQNEVQALSALNFIKRSQLESRIREIEREIDDNVSRWNAADSEMKSRRTTAFNELGFESFDALESAFNHERSQSTIQGIDDVLRLRASNVEAIIQSLGLIPVKQPTVEGETERVTREVFGDSYSSAEHAARSETQNKAVRAHKTGREHIYTSNQRNAQETQNRVPQKRTERNRHKQRDEDAR